MLKFVFEHIWRTVLCFVVNYQKNRHLPCFWARLLIIEMSTSTQVITLGEVLDRTLRYCVPLSMWFVGKASVPFFPFWDREMTIVLVWSFQRTGRPSGTQAYFFFEKKKKQRQILQIIALVLICSIMSCFGRLSFCRTYDKALSKNSHFLFFWRTFQGTIFDQRCSFSISSRVSPCSSSSQNLCATLESLMPNLNTLLSCSPGFEMSSNSALLQTDEVSKRLHVAQVSSWQPRAHLLLLVFLPPSAFLTWLEGL